MPYFCREMFWNQSNNSIFSSVRFFSQIALIKSPFSKKYSSYMLLSVVLVESFFKDALAIQAEKLECILLFALFLNFFLNKIGPGFVSMSPDLRRLIYLKRKEVKFRVIKKVALSFTICVNLKKGPCAQSFYSTICLNSLLSREHLRSIKERRQKNFLGQIQQKYDHRKLL